MAVADFGSSWRLADGDLVFTGGAFDPVSGVSNLTQALSLRVQTPLGSDTFNATYGLDTKSIFTEPAGSRLARDLVRLNLVRTLSADPRVREVLDIRFQAIDPQRRGWLVEVTLATAAQPVTFSLEVPG